MIAVDPAMLRAGWRKVSRLWRDEAREREMAANALLEQQYRRGEPTLGMPPAMMPPGAWELIGGDGQGWAADRFYKVRGMALMDGVLYAGLTGPTQEGPCGEIWALADGRWRHIGGGIAGSWPAEPAFVDHLTIHKGQLFAAVAGRLWGYADGAWFDVAGALPIAAKSGPYAFATFKDQLAVSVWGDPAVLLFDGAKCARLPEPAGGWGDRVRTAYCLAEFRGQLFAGTGTGKFFGQGSSVFRYDGLAWEKVAGDGVRGSWTQTGIPFVLSLTVFNDRLVATLSRPSDTPAAASNVWVFDGEEWRPLAVGRTPDLMARSLIMNDAIAYRGHLVVATGDSAHRKAAVWRLDRDQQWQTMSGSILEAGANGHPGGCWIYRLCTDGHSLYAGAAGHQGAARIFRWKPTEEDKGGRDGNS